MRVERATAAACEDVARALRLLRQAAEVEWVSDAADRYRAAVHEAFGIVLRTQVLVEAADLAVREHSAVAARAGPPTW